MGTRLGSAWYLHRRVIAVSCCVLAGLIALLVTTGVVIRLSGGRSHAPSAAKQQTTASPSPSTRQRTAGEPTDVGYWNARPAIVPAASAAFPAVPVTTRSDPNAYATAFATELFTRGYGTATRGQLLSWAQYEDAPLRSDAYPRADWTKVLEDSLTDLTWDQANDTPVPSQAVWLALAQDDTITHVSDVATRVDPQWEQSVSDGYAPTDPLMTVQDVSFELRSIGRSGEHVYDVSIALQLGTSVRGLYGVAATNDYVIREVR